MDTLVTTATLGTGQQNTPDLSTGTAVDTLAGQLPANDTERALLLTAGAYATYQQAGYTPQKISELPQPASLEPLPPCSPHIGQILDEMFRGERDASILPQALTLLQQAERRLPHDLLPIALAYGSQAKHRRSDIIPVLGERGRWLSRYNTEWAWVAQFLSDKSDTLPQDAETLWQEGTIGQRQEILRRLRTVEPAKARAWLEDVWKKEKAEARNQFITTFKVGLSLDDEPFLEKALDDRSDNVRVTAASLLVSLPETALVQRMTERADSMLAYTKGKRPLTKGKLEVTPPDELDVIWQRDSAVTKLITTNKKGQDQMILHVLSFVLPNHWEERFALTPTELIAAASRGEYTEALLEAWSEAATRYAATQWISPLWDWWSKRRGDRIQTRLIQHMAQSEAEEKALQNIDPRTPARLESLLTALPSPWSRHFSQECIIKLSQLADTFGQNNYIPAMYQWRTTLTMIVANLHHTSLVTAIDTCTRSIEDYTKNSQQQKTTNWNLEQWYQYLGHFTDLLRTRQKLLKEIK